MSGVSSAGEGVLVGTHVSLKQVSEVLMRGSTKDEAEVREQK